MLVEKDDTSARIALDLTADRLLLFTDVTAVMRDIGIPEAHLFDRRSVAQLTDLHLSVASMGAGVECPPCCCIAGAARDER